LALLERDGVNDSLALDAPEARLQDLPLGTVHHDRQAGAVLAGEDVQELRHRLLAVEEVGVHVYVENGCPRLRLLAGDGDSGFIIPLLDEPGERLAAGDVTAFTDHLEVALRPDDQFLCAAQPRPARQVGEAARALVADGLADGGDPVGPGAAAAADDVHPT